MFGKLLCFALVCCSLVLAMPPQNSESMECKDSGSYITEDGQSVSPGGIVCRNSPLAEFKPKPAPQESKHLECKGPALYMTEEGQSVSAGGIVCRDSPSAEFKPVEMMF